MSNRVDFYQSEASELLIPAGRVAVFVEGVLCSYCEPVEIVRSSWPEFGWARLKVDETSNSDELDSGKIESELKPGKKVCIKRFFGRGTSVEGIPIFFGKIETIESRLKANEREIEVVARDFSAELERITVYGRWIAREDGTVLFVDGAETVFNESSEADASGQAVYHRGRQLRLFAAEPLKSRLWSCAEAIDYLLGVYLPAGALQVHPLERLEALTGGQRVYDLDVTGMSLVEALRRCCERAGLKFRFVCRSSEMNPEQGIVFYRQGKGRSVELNCQRDGERLSVSGTDVSEFYSKRHPVVTHRYIGQGDVKRFEATFELVRGWDSALEETDYDKFSPSSNPQFIEVKDVYRRWVLNEAGDYSVPPYNQGDAFDFSGIFGSADFVKRRRRFWPAISCDKQGRSMGYYLEVSFDNGQHWWQYLGAFENRLDECGIWLSSDRLDIDTWVAALKGVLKFRITASVLSDERLSCEIVDGPVNSVVPVVDWVVTLPRQFKYRKVTGRSIFTNVTNSGLGEPDEADDSKSLYEFVRRKAPALSSVTETFDVKTAFLLLDIQPGDRVTSSPESRDLFRLRRDNRSIAWIDYVRMDFDKQLTKLKIKKQRRSYL